MLHCVTYVPIINEKDDVAAGQQVFHAICKAVVPNLVPTQKKTKQHTQNTQ